MKIKKILIIGIMFLFVVVLLTKNKEPSYSENEMIYECYSPNGLVSLKMFQGPPDNAIMVDYYVIGEIEYHETVFWLDIVKKEMIYYQYHEEFEEAYWINNDVVKINGAKIEINNKKTWINN